MDQWIEHLQSSNAECELHLLDDSSTLLKSQGLLEATECDVEELEPPSAVPLLPALSLVKFQYYFLSVLLLAIMNQVVIVKMRERLQGLIDLVLNGGIPTSDHLNVATEGLLYLRLLHLCSRPLSLCVLLQSFLDCKYY